MRKKIFIIHGKAITFYEAIENIKNILSAKIHYNNKQYYISPESQKLIKYILYEEHSNIFMNALEKILITRLTIAPYFPLQNDIPNLNEWISLSQYMLDQKLSNYNMPVSKNEKINFCNTELNNALKIILNIFNIETEETNEKEIRYLIISKLDEIQNMIQNSSQGKLFESDALFYILENLKTNNAAQDIVKDILIEIKKVYEGGGDLDTIASNALYGVWAFYNIAKEKGSTPLYGIDYEFDFANYQEGLRHLAKHKHCDIYLPDFPIDAIPDLEGDIKYLAEFDTYIRRFDDHHPYKLANKEILDKMLEEGLIDHYAMSGVLKEDRIEINKEEAKCGTDMIYEQLIKGQEWDNEGLKELQRLAHVQDLHIIEDTNAINISKIIGAKHSKIDMVQQMMRIQNKDDIDNILQKTGWDVELKEYEEKLAAVCPKLEKNMCYIVYTVKLESNEECYKRLCDKNKKLVDLFKKISFGALNFSKFLYKFDLNNQHKILVVLSPFQRAKETKINVATAINYLSEKISFDYIFYCYGSQLMTTRRVNPDDTSIDLSVLMAKIGSENDGGHAEAATCKPSSNKYFPSKKFNKISDWNFEEWTRYLADKVQKEFGYQIVKVEKAILPK